MYATYSSTYGWQVIKIDGRHATLIAGAMTLTGALVDA